jgi:hypothetical protein
VAPSAEAAAFVVAQRGLIDGASWVQVVVAEWSGALGEFIEPGNALIFSRGDTAPPGADLVVISRAEFEKRRPGD